MQLHNTLFVKVIMYLGEQNKKTDNSDEIVLHIGNDEVRSVLTMMKNLGFLNKIGGATHNPIWELTQAGSELHYMLKDQ